MRMKSLRLTNFRGYRDFYVEFSDLTAFIGKNDAGKSTVLEALDIFFNEGDGSVKFEKGDVNCAAMAEDADACAEIAVCFEDLPPRVKLDSAEETSLGDSWLLNAEGCLEVVKRYRPGNALSVSVRCVHPTCKGCADLLAKDRNGLKEIAKRLKLDCNMNSIASMRAAIWKHYGKKLAPGERVLDLSRRADLRKALLGLLPAFCLFQADRRNTDGDSEVQDPMRAAVKVILQDPELRKTLEEAARTVRDRLQSVFHDTLEVLGKMDPDAVSVLKAELPGIDGLRWADVFKGLTITDSDGIPLNKRGSGIRRLVLISFFRAEAEKSAPPAGVIYAMEEPETSQHSDKRIKLVETLKKLALRPGVQVLLTTHSGTVVKQLDPTCLRLIYNENCRKTVSGIRDRVLPYASLNEVNYVAFGEVSEEYHNELYGWIETEGLLQEFAGGREKVPYVFVRRGKDGVVQEKEVSLIRTTKIRHQIHHPENERNEHFTPEALAWSIGEMREFISRRRGPKP